jgi:hypothetical protein
MRRIPVLLVLAAAALRLAPMQAASANEGTLVGNFASSWQTNGNVTSVAYANGAVYLAGDFTSVRPPGAASGTGEVARDHMAAFSSTTGALLPFSHDFAGMKPSTLAASPDGTRIYAGGAFLTVDGQTRSRLAAFDTATGNLTSWNARTNAKVAGLAVSPDNHTVYVAGAFTTVNGQPHTRLGAVTDTGALVIGWNASAENTVTSVALAPDGSRVIVGGYFVTLNGDARRGTGSLDPTTGANEPWASANVLPPHSGSCTSDIKDVTVDASNAYFAAEGTGGGCFDGTFAARISDGALVWKNDCLGATQAVEVVGNFLYKGSHAHNCSAAGSFPEVTSIGAQSRHLLSERLSDGSIGTWWPNTNANGQLGPNSMATDGQRLFVGGDFTTVNASPQQGFVIFEPNPDLTKPTKPAVPRVSSVTPGQVTVSWQAVTDIDDEHLVYRVYRDGGSTPIFTSAPARSTFWILPRLSFVDTGLVPGSTHTYRVDAVEASAPNNASFRSNASATVTVATVNAPYPDTVNADAPSLYWRLGETSGVTAGDASGNGQTGTYRNGVTLGQASAIVRDSDTAARFDGVNDFASSDGSFANPRGFSVELWFKTATTSGGKLIGFGNSQTADSSNYDRHVYMDNSGKLWFGVWIDHAETITSTASYNDGQYHHLVASQSSSGMALYVDGAVVGTNPTASAQGYNGFWRVGGDNLNGWPSRPSSNSFNGTIDEAAVYNYGLTADQVATHFSHNA